MPITPVNTVVADISATPTPDIAPPHLSYSKVEPNGKYSPWLDDQTFQYVYATITQKRNTLVDIFRCYELWKLVEQVAGLGGDILEVGVWRGGTGCLMGHRAQALGSPLRVFLCDTFAGVVKATGMDTVYKGGEHANASAERVRELAARLDVRNIEILQGMFPEDTGHEVAGRKFALCHIDVDVYAGARDILHWVWPRLVVGGVVVFDDYGFKACGGVTHLVNEEFPRAGALMIHNLNGHAVVVKMAA